VTYARYAEVIIPGLGHTMQVMKKRAGSAQIISPRSVDLPSISSISWLQNCRMLQGEMRDCSGSVQSGSYCMQFTGGGDGGLADFGGGLGAVELACTQAT